MAQQGKRKKWHGRVSEKWHSRVSEKWHSRVSEKRHSRIWIVNKESKCFQTCLAYSSVCPVDVL